jgi:hypothetical protein
MSLIYFRLSSLLYLAVCLIAVKDWAKPPSDHVDPYHDGNGKQDGGRGGVDRDQERC